MPRFIRLSLSALFLVAAGSFVGHELRADDADAAAPAAKSVAKETPGADVSKSAGSEKAPAVKELSPELTALAERLRRTVGALSKQPFNARDNTPTDILYFCLAFGCNTNLQDAASAGQKLNGITCLCWNMPCAGYRPLAWCGDHLAARVGYGYQDHPGQFAATLALARTPADYPARAGDDHVRTVADLVEYEKLTCRSGADLSLKLVALSHYVSEPTWKNEAGEQWSLDRMVGEELDRPSAGLPYGGALRLLGLSAAMERRIRHAQPIDNAYARAKTYLEDSQRYAFEAQNGDGSWGRSTTASGAARDYTSALSATSRVLQWLILSLPRNRLDDTHVVQGIEYLNSLLGTPRYRSNVQALSGREIAAVMCAAHALTLYDQQLFQPLEAQAAARAKRDDKMAKRPAPRSE